MFSFLAPSVQNGWSRGLGVNLLVAGYHWPERLKMGSGVYSGYSDDFPAYSYSVDISAELIVAPVLTVKTKPSNYTIRPRKILTEPKKLTFKRNSNNNKLLNDGTDNRRIHVILHEDMSNYTIASLEKDTHGEEVTSHLCHETDNFCCDVTYKSNTSLIYKHIIYSGLIVKGYGAYQIYSQFCSVVWCRNENHTSCAFVEFGVPGPDDFGPAKFTAEFQAAEVFPLGIKRDLYLLEKDKYHLQNNGNGSYVAEIYSSVSDLLSLGLYGRWYDKDPEITI